MNSDADVSRRTFLRAAAGTTTAAAATGTATAQTTTTTSDGTATDGTAANGTAAGTTSGGGGGGGGGGQPDLGGYLSDANNFGGTIVDARGQQNVTVAVGAAGGFAYGPAAVHIDNGATITWEWTGEGGSHNVVAEGGAFDSGATQASGTFEHTFEEDGIYQYYCVPHKGQGMKGVVVVGNDYPTVQTGGDVGPGDLPSNAKALGVATMFVTVATLGLAYFFMKYGGDYGEFDE